MPEPAVHVHPSLDSLSRAAAARATLLLRTAPDGPITLALSGGSTPRPFHRELATTYREDIPWERLHVFWGDERFVPFDASGNNARMAFETLLNDVPIPPDQIHRIPTEDDDPEHAAARYEAELHRFFEGREARFDLMVMGVGDDGHTASLFPDHPALHETERWVRAVRAPTYITPPVRITMTLPLINQSRCVLFLVSGEKKKSPMEAILREGSAAGYPAARVTATESVDWFLDEAAYPWQSS